MRQRLAGFGVGDQVVEEGPLAAQGLQRPVRLDAAMVDAARQIEKPFGAVAEMRREPDRVRSDEHTSELQSLMRSSYAVFCLDKKHITTHSTRTADSPGR